MRRRVVYKTNCQAGFQAGYIRYFVGLTLTDKRRFINAFAVQRIMSEVRVSLTDRSENWDTI